MQKKTQKDANKIINDIALFQLLFLTSSPDSVLCYSAHTFKRQHKRKC